MISHTLMLYLAPEASRDICSVDRLRSLKVAKIPLSSWQCLHLYVESSINEGTSQFEWFEFKWIHCRSSNNDSLDNPGLENTSS